MSLLLFNRKVIGGKFYSYKEWLQDYDQKIVLFTQVDRPDLASYDHVELIDFFDRDGCTEIRAIELHSRFEFDSIAVHSEYDLIRAARLRQRFGLSGQNIESATAYRDKVLMKDYLHKAGIKAANHKRLDSPIDLYEFASEHGFPVIVKPVDAGGARYIKVVENMEELKTFLSAGLPSGFMVETFINGSMYHADGIVKDGEMLFSCISRYVYGCLAYQQKQSVGSFVIEQASSIAQRINLLLSEIIEALPTPPVMAFHGEFFHTDDDQIYVCEIASRTAGGRIMETVEHSYGVDIIKSWIRLQCGLATEIAPKLNRYHGYLVVPPRKGKLEAIPQTAPFPWVIGYGPTVEAGQLLSDPVSNGDNIATTVIEGETPEIVEQRLMEFNEWFLSAVRLQ